MSVEQRPAHVGRAAASALALLVAAGCGRASYRPVDSGLDAALAVVDGGGIDGGGLDAGGVDGGSIDAGPMEPGDAALPLDAPPPDALVGVDAPQPDAALDAAVPPGCPVRWAQRATSASTELVLGAFPADDGLVYVSVSGNPPTTFAGSACPRCFVSFTRDGARVGFGGTSSEGLQWVAGPGGIASESLSGGAFVIRRHALGTMAEVGVLGMVQHDGASSGRRLAVRGDAVLYEADLGGTITGASSDPVTTDDLAVVLVHYVAGVRRWGRVLDGPGSQHALTARILASGDVGVFFRNLGTGPACLEPGRCIARVRSGAAVLSGADGSLLSLFEAGVGVGSIVLDDRGAIVQDNASGMLERRDGSGALVWSRAFRPAPLGVSIAHDAARRRVVVFTSIDGGSGYDGVPLRHGGADGAGLALLELDDATGAALRTLVFGSDGTDSASDVSVDEGGRIYASMYVGGDVDLCAGGGGHGGSTDGLLVAID